MQRDVLEHVAPRPVAEPHIFEADFASHRRREYRIGAPPRSLGRGFGDVGNALRCRTGCLQRLIQPLQLADRLVEQAEIEEKPDELAECDLAGGHHGSAAPERQHGSEGGKERDGRRVRGPRHQHHERASPQRGRAAGEPSMFLLLEVEQLDLPDPLKVVGEQRIQGADRVPKQPELSHRDHAVGDDGENQQRQRNEGQERQLRVL